MLLIPLVGEIGDDIFEQVLDHSLLIELRRDLWFEHVGDQSSVSHDGIPITSRDRRFALRKHLVQVNIAAQLLDHFDKRLTAFTK